MIPIPFDPEIHLGPFSLAWHGIFTAVGIFFGVWLSVKLVTAQARISEADANAIAFWGVVGGIIGARVFHVADCWTACASVPDGYVHHLELIPQIWTGGIAVWGAALGGVLGGLIVALRRGTVPIGFGADAAAPGISLGFAIGRIGDIINGEHHATACDAPFGICVGYTNPSTLGQPGPVHLAVAYDMAWTSLGVALVLLLMRTALARAPQGRIFWTWVLWYTLGRFMLGFLRVGDPTPILGLRQDQLVAVIAATVALPALVLVQTNVLPGSLP